LLGQLHCNLKCCGNCNCSYNCNCCEFLLNFLMLAVDLTYVMFWATFHRKCNGQIWSGITGWAKFRASFLKNHLVTLLAISTYEKTNLKVYDVMKHLKTRAFTFAIYLSKLKCCSQRSDALIRSYIPSIVCVV
jgi:hypothetical protein